MRLNEWVRFGCFSIMFVDSILLRFWWPNFYLLFVGVYEVLVIFNFGGWIILGVIDVFVFKYGVVVLF